LSAIAIVGISCRFGGSPDLHAYWDLILSGKDAFRRIPEDRFDASVLLDQNRRATEKIYTDIGAFIDGVKSFPGLHYGIPPRRLEVMDPQHRVAMEVAVEAVEDSGRQTKELPRRTGVFIGQSSLDFRSILAVRTLAQGAATGAYGTAEDPEVILRAIERIVPIRPYSAPGGLSNMAAAMIAQELDLQGPAYTIDSACASAMICIADAVHQLRNGSIDAAIAGGSSLVLTPENFICFCRIGAMSAQGKCLPFEERADGFVQGDGAGAFLLKRLEDAQRDGDRIYALLHGIATNNDGRGDGPMAPHPDGQSAVIRAAWADAGVDLASVGYIEAHGTGTDVGDPAELTGLRAVFGDKPKGKVALGSAKANVGHTMASAGVAGLARAVMAVHHGVIPPMANFQNPKAKLELGKDAWYVPTKPEAWESEERYAGVSSFGFGGTNAHAVVGAYHPPKQLRLVAPSTVAAGVSPAGEQAELLVLSAPDEATLRNLAARTAQVVARDPRITLAGVVRTWAARPKQAARLGVVAKNKAELVEKLAAIGKGELPQGARIGTAKAAPKIAFLYPGQGAQRVGMLAGLRDRFPVVADTLVEMEKALGDLLPVPLTHLLWPERRNARVTEDEARAQLTDTASQQPAMHACGVALTRLLAQLGVEPVVTTGHSLGEFTAAAAAGVVDPGAAARFVARRGRAMADLPGDHGAMAAVMAEPEKVRELLVDGAVLANFNHPRQVVVSGTTEAVAEVVRKADAAGVKAVKLEVSHAFHSPVLAGLDPEPLLADLDVKDPVRTVASGIASAPYTDAAYARDVFRRHATSPVDFVGALRQCQEAGADLFLQVGAGGPLAAFARGVLPKGSRILTLASTDDHDGGASLLETLAALWVEGVDLDVKAITAPAEAAAIPPTILPKEEYWVVKEAAQLLPKLPGVTAQQPQKEQVKAPAAHTAGTEARPTETPAAATEAPAAGTDEVLEKVLAIVSRVSAYPRDALKPAMRLQDDLGFDSLMVGDLATGLADAFPGLGGIPQEMLLNRPTVNDIVEYARGKRGGAAAVNDDAPLGAFRPAWVEVPLPKFADRRDPRGAKVLVAGALGPATQIRKPFDAAGCEVVIAEAAEALAFDAPVDLLVYVPGRDAERGDRTGELIALLARQAKLGGQPDLIVLPDGPAGMGLTAVARAMAREWPDAVCKSVFGVVDPSLVLREWLTPDRSADVLYKRAQRFVAGLEPADAPKAGASLEEFLGMPAKGPERTTWEPGPGEVVAITGGTRGIGAKLGARLGEMGCKLVLVGRGEPDTLGKMLVSAGAVHLKADVTDPAALAPLAGMGITAVVHSAGVLADGPVDEVDPKRGQLALAVKKDGLANVIAACGQTLRVALAIGSWAGRFGNRHQAFYAAANGAMADQTMSFGVRTIIAEFGPWSTSDMAKTIPAPVQQAMRAEGVDFVGDEAGMAALIEDLRRRQGVVVHGRDLPPILRSVLVEDTLAPDTHPFLRDHAVPGPEKSTPVLPLAGAADLIAWAADVPVPFEVTDLRLFQGIAVTEPVKVQLAVRNDRVELRIGERRTLAYKARVRPASKVEAPAVPSGGRSPELPLKEFYSGITFHGPMLQGIVSIDAIDDAFVRGKVRTGKPADWMPGTKRAAWTVDPLMLDSAFQLAAYAAWVRFKRAGTPVGIARYVQLRPSEGTLVATVTFGEIDGDRFTATIQLSDAAGLVAVCENVAAELRAVEGTEPEVVVKKEWVDFGEWAAVKDLEQRLQLASMVGIRNPYFAMHEGTARDTTVVGGRTLVNFSSYNYLGLSGDPRVLDDVNAAIHKYGTSVSASRVASGQRPFHADLERELAACQGAEDAILFTAGHATNVTTIGHLLGAKDLVLHDELIHDSALQGIKLSGATRRAFKHDDPADLEKTLRQVRKNFEKVLIVVEGVYSMDGDICQLPAYIALKKKWGCLLMVDEAHSFGIVGATGCGVREHFGIDGRDVDIWMGTLSKSLASCGGWIAGSAKLVNFLRYTAPGFVYSAGLTPANGQAALSSLRLMLAEPWRVAKLQHNARFFQKALSERGIDTGPAKGGSAVVPAVTGNSMHALMLSQRLVDQGINVQPIVYPAVADDAARLRFFLSSTHSEEQLSRTADCVRDTLAAVRAEFKV
jgi:8-amino-7-oxononanoate synthase